MVVGVTAPVDRSLPGSKEPVELEVHSDLPVCVLGRENDLLPGQSPAKTGTYLRSVHVRLSVALGWV